MKSSFREDPIWKLRRLEGAILVRAMTGEISATAALNLARPYADKIRRELLRRGARRAA